jgi:hypothetical protein
VTLPNVFSSRLVRAMYLNSGLRNVRLLRSCWSWFIRGPASARRAVLWREYAGQTRRKCLTDSSCALHCSHLAVGDLEIRWRCVC